MKYQWKRGMTSVLLGALLLSAIGCGGENPTAETQIDIRPYLDDMLSHGLADGYFDAQTLSELCINGMNLGWETIGTFDHTMEMRNLRLDSYIDE